MENKCSELKVILLYFYMYTAHYDREYMNMHTYDTYANMNMHIF